MNDSQTLSVVQRLRQLPLWQPLALRDFRLLWFGQSVSLLGDQFYLVALPWLTLQLTGSSLALGTVLMTAAIPRAVFMLVGGAVSDRFSPRTLMLVSNVIRAVVVALITGLVWQHAIQLWHLYLFALVFGLVDAFFYPAFMSIVPLLVNKDRLEAGNALLGGTAQLSGLIGPAPAGLLISAVGLGAAFAVNTATFTFAALMFLLMRTGNRSVDPQQDDQIKRSEPVTATGLIRSIHEGLRYAWHDPVTRGMLFMVAAIDFSFVGPFIVGVASLANRHFAGGATAFGTMLSTWGGGALLGAIIAGSIGRPRRRGVLLLTICGILGPLLALIGFAPNVVWACIVIGAMGSGAGFLNVVSMAWLQGKTEPQMLGRVMSLVMFASQGLAPFSYAIAGALADLHVTIMFAAAGAIIVLATAFATTSRQMRTID
jgi:MFS family permease